jgi:molybdate transport system substrate-binding protein
MSKTGVWLFAIIMLWSEIAFAATVHVAVAANFKKPMQQLITIFESQSPHKILLSSGSTGKLYNQIVNGAPYHIFLAADSKRPQLLEESPLAVPGSRFSYATGRLVLVSATSKNQVVDETFFSHNSPGIIAMPNPKVAPYGRAAQEVMTAIGVWNKYKERTALGENVGQTLAFIASETLTTGFVALSQIHSLGNKIKPNRVWTIPQSLYTPLVQDGILLKAGAKQPGATALLDFLKSGRARSEIAKMGYTLP